MLHRVRAHMRFPRSSGLATWCRDNMAVRHGQAVHIRQGEPGEEEPVNEVTRDGSSDVFRCDLALMNEAHAADAFNTLSAPTVLGQSLVLDPDGLPRLPWVEHHTCDHAEAIRSGCVVVSRAEGVL